jgi:fibronectin type 3 domain-containing protein
MTCYTLYIRRNKKLFKEVAVVKNNDDLKKIHEYLSLLEKEKYKVMENNIDWDKLYESEDSYEDIVFNF